MNSVPIPIKSKVLNDLLKKARRRSIILEAADGQRFVLASLNDWEGFDVGKSQDFSSEVAHTGANDELMGVLASRSKSTGRTSLADVKKKLGAK